jgi:two-component system OmpR family response regulator
MKRLLVIEDDEPIADLLARGLRLAGYEVAVETDGQAGLERWAQGGLAAVILDVMLPGANGLDIAAERRMAGDRTPILLLTARDDAGVRRQATELEIDALMVKPFVYRELVARLADLTGRDIEPVPGSADRLDG